MVIVFLLISVEIKLTRGSPEALFEGCDLAQEEPHGPRPARLRV
jgi:hypothetical protein